MPRFNPAVLALATTLAACGPTTSTGGPLPAPITASRASAQWMATLAPVGTSTVRGMTMVNSMSDRQTVQISITGGAASAVYPWHIHTGSCAGGMGAIVGPPSSYTALGAGSDGSASLTIDLPLMLDASQHYHVNVHASPSDMGTIVSCGDLAMHGM